MRRGKMETVNSREPIFGPNAKPFAIQAVTAIVVVVAIKLFLWDWVSPAAMNGYFCAIGWGPC